MKGKTLILYMITGFLLAAGIQVCGVWGGTGEVLYDGKTDQTVTGKINFVNVGANATATLSGASIFGCAVTGAANGARPVTSGITLIAVSPSGGENFWIYNNDDTSISGETLYVHFAPGDTVVSNVPCTPGVSKYVIAGTAMEKKLVLWSNGTSTWVIDAIGDPDVEAD